MNKRMRGGVAFGMAMLVALSGASAPILAYAEEASTETVAQEMVAENGTEQTTTPSETQSPAESQAPAEAQTPAEADPPTVVEEPAETVEVTIPEEDEQDVTGVVDVEDDANDRVVTSAAPDAKAPAPSTQSGDEVTTHDSKASITYRTHVQRNGWQGWRKNGKSAGTHGKSLRLEGIQIKLAGVQGGIRYRTHVQGIGWQGWKSNGTMSGTRGKSKRLEGIRISLTGEAGAKYDVYYRVHAQKFGWMGWAKNGESAGTEGYSYRLEAIQITLVPKGGAAPGSTQNAFRKAPSKKKASKGISAIQGWWSQVGGLAMSPSKQVLYRSVLHVEGTTARIYSGRTMKNGNFLPAKQLTDTIELQSSKVRRVNGLLGMSGWYFDQLHLFLPDNENDTLWRIDANGRNYSGTSSYGRLSGKPSYF